MNQSVVIMKKTIVVICSLAVIVALLQLLRPDLPESRLAKDLSGLPADISELIRNSCFDCHSTETDLSWYDKLTPAKWIVNEHIRNGRAALNFSKWDSLTTPAQNNILFYSLNKVLQKEMPLPSYATLHPGTKFSEADIRLFKNFLKSRIGRKQQPAAKQQMTNQQGSDLPPISQASKERIVLPSPNGIEYIPDYRNWKLISITDRFDNGTMRMIFGNETAINAISQHNTDPWPDGTIFAKAAWKQKMNTDGSMSPGDFFQVEFMIKDAKKYANEKGWGWARWRGPDLKPYGATATFTTECVSCHKPLKDNDFVFTKPLYLNIDSTKNNLQ